MENKRANVLFFGAHINYRFGGAEKSAHILLKELRERGVQVKVVSGDWSYLKGKLTGYDYPDVIRIPFFHHPYFFYLSYFMNYLRAARPIRRLSSDLLFAQSWASVA